MSKNKDVPTLEDTISNYVTDCSGWGEESKQQGELEGRNLVEELARLRRMANAYAKNAIVERDVLLSPNIFKCLHCDRKERTPESIEHANAMANLSFYPPNF